MTWKKSRFDSVKEMFNRWQLEKYYARDNQKDILIYSQSKGIAYALVFSILLWWLPVAGPALAGYLAGRKSGTVTKAIFSSLIATSVIMLLTLSLLPFKEGVLSSFGTYLNTGVLALSQSKLVSSSNFLTDMYTSYGIIKTFSIIIPSSIITLNIFSYVGGFYTTLKTQEEKFSRDYMSRNVEDKIYSASRNRPKVQIERKKIREFNSGENDTDDGFNGWSYL